MGEVACTALTPMFAWLEARRIAPDALLEGTGYELARLRQRHRRIPWDDFALLAGRFEALAGGPEVMPEVGRQVLSTPGWRELGRVSALLVSPQQLYAFMDRTSGWAIFGIVQSTLRELADGRLEMVLTIPEPYQDCPTFFRICEGTFPQVPTLLGHAPAEVVATIEPRLARYLVTLLPSHRGRGWRQLLRRVFKRLRNPEEVLDELARHQVGVQRALKELGAARQDLKVQAEALKASEARWRGLLASVPDHVLLLELDGTIAYVNRRDMGLPHMVGMRLQEVPGARPERIEEALAEVREGRTRQSESLWAPPGGQERWFSIRYGPVVRDGEVIGAVVVARDISEVREAEQERLELERRLLHTQKVESLGLLAGGIAHDFNNLVMGMMGNAGLAALELPPDSPAQPLLERIESGGMRAAALVEQMLDFAGRRARDREPVELSALVAEMADLLRASQPGQGRLRFELAADLPAVEGDPVRLQQVVMNLITNAAEAAGEDGAIRVRTAGVDTPGGPQVLFEVEDEGPGMDEAVQRRMFDPFFSTRGPGRGMGLSAVLGIVQAHQGEIQVESAPGRGTRVRVLLPAGQGASPPKQGPGEAEDRLVRGAGRLLVVEDEPLVREAARGILLRHGFEVLSATDGEEALQRLAAESFDLVLLDITMPGRTGLELLSEIRERWPAVRVVLTSAREPEALGREVPFLRKPYPARRLLELVEEAMATS